MASNNPSEATHSSNSSVKEIVEKNASSRIREISFIRNWEDKTQFISNLQNYFTSDWLYIELKDENIILEVYKNYLESNMLEFKREIAAHFRKKRDDFSSSSNRWKLEFSTQTSQKEVKMLNIANEKIQEELRKAKKLLSENVQVIEDVMANTQESLSEVMENPSADIKTETSVIGNIRRMFSTLLNLK